MKHSELCLYCLAINEAKKIKAVNEDGVDPENYDDSEINALKVWALSLERPVEADGLESFLIRAQENENIIFNDCRESGYLLDVMADNLSYFKNREAAVC